MNQESWEIIFRLVIRQYVPEETTVTALAKELAKFMEAYGK